MKTSILSETKHHLLEKGAVAATALSIFYFCNPSSVLAPFLLPSLLFKDLNLQYFARRPKLHLLILKQQQKKTFFVFEFEPNSGPTLASQRQIGREIVERIDDRKKKTSVTAGKQVSGINGGVKRSFFRIRITFLKILKKLTGAE